MQLASWIMTFFWYSCPTKVSSAITPVGENLFVYLSQSSGHNTSLTDLCNEDAIDVVILGFVRSFTEIEGYPKIDFGPSLCNATRSEDEILAPGLAVCLELGQEVKQCQEKGKNIFVSIGGSTSNTSFEAGKRGRDEAVRAARLMWNLFGEGMESPSLRPFGPNVIIDGYDIDDESRQPENQHVFLSTLRSYRTTASKPIFISIAPGCTRVVSRATLVLVDFVFIRFYNSASCALGTRGFASSLQEWYQSIVPKPYEPYPKVFLGALSFNNNNTGYVSAAGFRDAVWTARKPNFTCWWNENKFGGIVLWDGPRGLANTIEPDLNFVTYAKNILL